LPWYKSGLTTEARQEKNMNKIAVITGATSGIGAAYARRLAKDGYDLVITGRRIDIIRKLAEDLPKQYGIKVDVIIAELSNDYDFQKLADVIRTKDVDMLINNAGYSGYARHFEEVDIAEHENMIKVHEIIPIRLISLILPGMIKRGRGNIINVSSIGAFMPARSNTVYCATKAFLKSYSQSLYLELKEKGVKVQVLCPGNIPTNFGKNYYPEDIYESKMAGPMLMSPEKVVDSSLKSLKKNKLVCIPGFSNQLMVKLFPSLPMSIYSGLVNRMSPFK
jgi:short-subunit dehydrogenase